MGGGSDRREIMAERRADVTQTSWHRLHRFAPVYTAPGL